MQNPMKPAIKKTLKIVHCLVATQHPLPRRTEECTAWSVCCYAPRIAAILRVFKKIANILFISSALMLIFTSFSLFTQAQEGSDAEAPEESAVAEFSLDKPTQCVSQFRPFFADKQREFAEFINSHFQSDLPATALIPAAVEKYRQFRAEGEERIDEIIQSYISKGGANAQAANSERASCEEVFKNESLIIKDLLRQHMLSNAYAKKTTRLMNKYKEINSQLEKLNFTVAQMYGYFSSLSQRLPCYATQCVKG